MPPKKGRTYVRAKDYLDEIAPDRPTKCNKLPVPEKVCYIDFRKKLVKGQIKNAKQLGTTIRDEMVIVDYDKDGKIVGIELVNEKMKPCQQG